MNLPVNRRKCHTSALSCFAPRSIFKVSTAAPTEVLSGSPAARARHAGAHPAAPWCNSLTAITALLSVDFGRDYASKKILGWVATWGVIYAIVSHRSISGAVPAKNGI